MSLKVKNLSQMWAESCVEEGKSMRCNIDGFDKERGKQKKYKQPLTAE